MTLMDRFIAIGEIVKAIGLRGEIKHSADHVLDRYVLAKTHALVAELTERMVRALDTERFPVKGVYLYGSVKNGTARPDSDRKACSWSAAADAPRDRI